MFDRMEINPAGLLDVIKSLGEKIPDVKAVEFKPGVLDEAWTRDHLIDPVLITLGWEIARKGSAREEKRIDYDRVADYVLYHEGRIPFAIVEAKRVGEKLEKHEQQLFDYMESAFVDIGALTDGIRWIIYRRIDHTGYDIVMDLENISTDLAEESAKKLITILGKGKNLHPSKLPKKLFPKTDSLNDGWVEVDGD